MNLLTIDGTQPLVAEVVAQVKAAVVATMGPNGKLAYIANGTAVKVTKDGVTVARSIKFDDPRSELVNRVITEAAIKTDAECGDGTTTTVLLTAVLYDIFTQHTSFREQKFIEECVYAVVEELKAMSINIKVDDPRLFKLALTSSNNDVELSQIVTGIYKESGERFPEIELKEGMTVKDKVVRSNGLPINMHFANPAFAKDGNGGNTEFKDFIPVIVDTNLGRGGDPMPALRQLMDKYAAPAGTIPVTTIVLIGRSVEHEMNNLLARINTSDSGVRFIPINTNAGGSVGTLIMQDIATMFGTSMYAHLDDAVVPTLDKVQGTLTVGSSRSVFSDIPADIQVKLQERADAIAVELSGYEMGDRFSVRAKFNETRIRNLRGELVTIFVGGETYSDVKERIDRFEDVVKAVKSALENGVLPGVGSSLVTAGQRVLTRIFKELPGLSSPNREQDTADDRAVSLKVGIIGSLGKMCYSSYNHLMAQSSDEITPFKELSWNSIEGDVVPECMNLATGERGTSEALGVYDTAYATITALKGGLQTAKILANASSILLGDKLSMVAVGKR